MDEDNNKPLTDEEVLNKMSAKLREMATELEFGSIEFACKIDVYHKKVKQIDLIWPNGITKRFR